MIRSDHWSDLTSCTGVEHDNLPWQDERVCSESGGSGAGFWRFLSVLMRGQHGQMRWCKGGPDKGGLQPLTRGPIPPRAPARLLSCHHLHIAFSSALHPPTHLTPPPSAIRRPSRRPALVRPRHHDLDAALGRGRRPPSVCQIQPRLHVGGGQALRARGNRHHGGWKRR